MAVIVCFLREFDSSDIGEGHTRSFNPKKPSGSHMYIISDAEAEELKLFQFNIAKDIFVGNDN